MLPLLRFYVVIIASFLLPCFSYAASLQVFPVNINFAPGENVKAIYVNNIGNDPISAQVRVYQWTQTNDNDVLTETQNLVVSPPMTAIPPGKQQLLRVIMPSTLAGSGELSYKLVVDELPGAADKSGRQAVRFLLRYTLPVFINTPKQALDMNEFVFHLNTHTSPERLTVENHGSQHLKLSNVLLSSGQHQVTLNRGLLGYVLAHSTRSWLLPKGKYSGSTLTFTINDDTTTKTVPVITQ